jgi:hypothetical protein
MLLLAVPAFSGCRRGEPKAPPPAQHAPQAPTTTHPTATVVTPEGQQRRQQLAASLDPQRDGWASEAVAEVISQRFARLAASLESTARSNDPWPIDLLAPDCQCGTLLPASLVMVLQDRAIHVQRDADPRRTGELSYASAAEVTEQLRALSKPFRGLAAVRFSFKVVHIVTSADSATAQAMFEARGQSPQGTLQLNANWQTRWTLPDSLGGAQLRAIQVADFEQVTTTTGHATLYSDCTQAVLGRDDSFRRQLQYGAGYWMQRLPAYLSPRLLEAHIGLAIGDVNEDGRDDVYVCQPGGLPNRLYVQRPDGTAADVAQAASVDLLDWSYSALIVDLDNDGHQDLVVLTDSQVVMYQGNGTGRFAPRARLPGTFEYAITAADYDQDGDLDLYVCNYFAQAQDNLAQLERTDPLHDSNTGGHNALFRNDGAWSFADVTEQVGLNVNNRRWSLAAAWEDYDNDGDPDLYVVNDFGHNNLYRNDQGRFVEVAVQAGAVDANQGMSASWADYDHDGWMDVYISNMFSAAGNRVTTQPNFMPGLADETKGLYQQLARGNTLLHNQGDGTFRDVSIQAGVTMGRWAWASLFTDVNNDGWDDLLVTNGYLTQENADDL